MNAIEALNLGKCYRIYPSPRARLVEWLCWDRVRLHDDFWALRDVAFNIRRGEAVGIVGFNGSGKSTLLQLIAGVLSPSEGSIRTHGRVGAILELGAGFNPEYSGRQNARLYGAVLGIPPDAIAARMGEIQAFADIGDFFDRPVKLYSSGMHSRLAFAVTTQVQPDILIVDEALAVGDAMFQRKCMATLEAMRRRGTTILFVSHSMETVKAVCDRAILLDKGRLILDGAPIDAANEYSRLMTRRTTGQTPKGPRPTTNPMAPRRVLPHKVPQAPIPKSVLVAVDLLAVGKAEFPYGTCEAEIHDLETLDEQGRPTEAFVADSWFTLRYKVRFDVACTMPIYGMTLLRLDGVAVYGINTLFESVHVDSRQPSDIVQVEVRFPLSLTSGNYYITVGVGEFRNENLTYLHRRCDAVTVRVLPVGPVVGITNLHGTIDVLHAPADNAAAA